MAEQIAVMAQGIMGQAAMPAANEGSVKGSLPEGDNMDAPMDPTKDNAIVSRARERAANTSRPD